MHRKIILLFSLFALLQTTKLMAQNDSVPQMDLLGEISANDNNTVELLPSKMVITQRLLWGKRGLMRNFKAFKLTPENRERELKVRRIMLVTHQVTGFATLGAMVAQGIVGGFLYAGHNNLRDAHEALAVAVNIEYFTTASLALFAPPKMLNERKGYSSIKLHKALAVIHLSSMIATNVLAGMLESHPELRPYHRAAAYTAFGSFAAAMIVIKF